METTTMNKVYKVFPGGKFKVLTFSYDDGKIEDRRLVKLFNKFNLKATFNLNTGIIDPAIRIPQEEWPELYKGHDIAVHTFTHPTMIRLNDYNALREILDDKDNLEKIFKRPIYGLAYPNGSYDNRIVDIAKSVGIKYARVTNDKYAATKAAEAYAANADGPMLIGDENGFSMPEDYMCWVPTCHHNHNLIDFGKKFMALTKKQYLYMMYVWGHSYEFDRDNNWYVIEEFCKMIGGREDIWYATNAEVCHYLMAVKQVHTSVDEKLLFNGSGQDIYLIRNGENILLHPGELQRIHSPESHGKLRKIVL